MKHILIIALVLVAKVWGSALPSSPYVYTIGKAERSLDSDIIAIHISATGNASDYQTAVEKMSSEASAIFSVLVSTEPQFNRDDPRRIVTGYFAIQEITATVRDSAQAANLVSRLLEKGTFTLQVGDPDRRSGKRQNAN